jgi:lipoate---protein ligase
LTASLDERVTGAFRYLDETLPTVEENLALDEALLLAAEERGAGPVLRVWESPVLAVVLGASCRLNDDVAVELCRSEGVVIARRSSGGGTVLIGPGALNVTVVLPVDAAPGLAAVDTAQAFVLESLARSLSEAGQAIMVQGSGDLTLGDRKFAGSAQRRLRRFFLVHASLLYDFPIGLIVRYTRLPHRQPSYRAGRAHDEFLTNLRLPRETILDAVRASWLPTKLTPARPELPRDVVEELVGTKFGDPAWVTRL